MLYSFKKSYAESKKTGVVFSRARLFLKEEHPHIQGVKRKEVKGIVTHCLCQKVNEQLEIVRETFLD